MDVSFEAKLLACATGEPVNATICELNREDAKLISRGYSDKNWWALIDEVQGDPKNEPDHHWDWVKIVSVQVLNKPMWRSVCVKSAVGRIQGAMAYWIGAASVLEPGKKAVFIDRLATAPWNRSNLVQSPEFRGVGQSLLRFAMVESVEYGLEGRVTLFPIANLDFYESRGLQRTAEQSTAGDNLFELSATEAQAVLRSIGVIQ